VDEKQAIALLKRGDAHGLEVLVHLYQLQALRTACLITGDLALAEDIVQNAFLRAADRIGQFDDQRPFRPWFLRSVVNDAIKAAKRQYRLVSLDDDSAAGAIDLIDPTPLPEELVESAETSQAVWRALCQLPPDQRAAIVLRYYLGMSEDTMAEELHRPAGTVKWWLYTARQRLGKILGSSRLSDLKHPSSPQMDQKSGEKL
jgi:RNA polymerase sigma-70 factor (ECF subfamily)